MEDEKDNKFSEQDMKNCFGAGVNRGVSIARAIIERIDLDDEFPPFQEYMEKYKEK